VENEETLLKFLGEISKRMTEEGKSRVEAFKDRTIPRSLKGLTVFQEPGSLWIEPPQELPGSTRILFEGLSDNSNTQFAMLALWAARRHGIPLEPTFQLLAERFERSQQDDGWWLYRSGQRGPTRSMIGVGLLGLAIGRGLKLPTRGAIKPGADDILVLKGLTALSLVIGSPTGQMKNTVPLQDYYFLWTVERVAMLFDLPSIGDKEWYRWGAEILVTNQEPGGEWFKAANIGPFEWQTNYGPAMNTAFALLFLKHSHPMKELTPKLPFTAKQLNQGIARLRQDDNLLRRTTTTSSESRNLEGKSRKRDP
jgi:hypothetical protein